MDEIRLIKQPNLLHDLVFISYIIHTETKEDRSPVFVLSKRYLFRATVHLACGWAGLCLGGLEGHNFLIISAYFKFCYLEDLQLECLRGRRVRLMHWDVNMERVSVFDVRWGREDRGRGEGCSKMNWKNQRGLFSPFLFSK